MLFSFRSLPFVCAAFCAASSPAQFNYQYAYAMGAQRSEVLRLIVSESLALVAAGLVVGIALALAGGEYVASQLYGLAANDAGTIAAAIALMIVVSAAAGYLPARRAARVDPMIALRYE